MPPRGRAAPAANSACLIRLQKDLEDVPTLGNVKLTFPDPNVLQHFVVRIVPEQGIWRGAPFDFDFRIPDEWPMERPKVKIITRIWHPNLAEPPECGVSLNILARNYSPVLQITQVIAVLQSLFSEPNALDPLNFEAARQYQENYNAFKLKAEEYISQYCDDMD